MKNMVIQTNWESLPTGWSPTTSRCFETHGPRGVTVAPFNAK